ncbi:MAG: sodium:proton exchanger [Sulfuricurvum sp. PC08-66]|nr:MAG: sodium:proton exchanger [Sulfuricurvum sp. PC08-66]
MLGIIVATLFIALLSNIVLKRFGLPTIIGYIITGTTISYTFGLHDAVNNHTLKEIAEFGVVFLMFTIGLEFSIKHLRDMKYEVFVVGTLQIVATALIIFGLGHYLIGLDSNSALVIAMAASVSSTAIVLKIFNETGEISKRYGRNALGMLIMQDISVIPILIIIGTLGAANSDLSELGIDILFNIVILLVAVYIAGRYLLEPFFAHIVKTNSDELFVGLILFLAIGASYGAHLIGFSYSLGAFAAGMMIAETKYKHQAEADLIPFRDLLLGIFFITVGMQIHFDIIANYLHWIVILLVVLMSIKFVVIYTIVRFKNDKRTTLKTALSLVQVGEFALAILELARGKDLVAAPYGQVLIVTIVLSMIMTPLILKNLSKIADLLIKHDTLEGTPQSFADGLHEHVVILGYGEFGQSVANKLKVDENFYVVVENSIDRFYSAVHRNEPVIFGNAASKLILEKANIKQAKSVIAAIDNPHKLYYICHELLKIVNHDKIIAKVHSIREKDALIALGIKHIIVENEETAKAIAQII